MNILFIGDYRSAANYGSIATTECLIDLINSLIACLVICLKKKHQVVRLKEMRTISRLFN